MPPPVALVLMNGSTAGSSRVIRGSSVMNNAPMIDPEIVADTADQHHRDELHRQQQVERCRRRTKPMITYSSAPATRRRTTTPRTRSSCTACRFTPITSAAMSRSRIAAKARPMRDRARLRAEQREDHQQHQHQQVQLLVAGERRAVDVEPGSRTARATGAGRPTPAPPVISVHSRKMCSPMKTRPSVTIARYSPRSRAASGATSSAGQRGHDPGGQQPDRHVR